MCVYTKKRTVTECDYDRSIWAYLLGFKSELVNFQSTVKTEHVVEHESKVEFSGGLYVWVCVACT